MTEEDTNYGNIKKDFSDSNNTLKKQITGIDLKQQEIQKYIATIDNAVTQLEQLIYHEQNQPSPNYNKIKSLRGAITNNIELVSNLYNSYKEFEMVKFRYYKEVDDNNYKMHRLIELELKKVDQNVNKLGEEFYNMMRNLSQISNSDNEITDQANQILQNDEEYDI